MTRANSIIILITLVVLGLFLIGFLGLTLTAKSIELENMPGNLKAFLGSFLLIGIDHGTYINTFCAAAFRADQMMVVMLAIYQFINIAGAAENLMDNIQLGQQGKIAIDRIQGNIGLLLLDLLTDLLGSCERRTGGQCL